MTRYGFRQALGALFIADYGALQQWVPAGMVPLQAQPGFGVFAVTAFDFVDSEVGAYGELVFSVLVPPWAAPGAMLPDAAYFPVVLATTSEASRLHAAERWGLPSHDRPLEIRFDRTEDRATVHVSDGHRPVMQLSVGRLGGEPAARSYQCWSTGHGDLKRVTIDIDGVMDEHEEELGLLELAPHRLVAHLVDTLQDEVPFREHSMGAGEQRFGPLTPHGGPR